MSDLISRQEAKDALAKLVPYAICDTSTESYTNGLTDAYNLICQLPSAQPEIIRCKDCKHWYSDADVGMACEFTNLWQPKDGFCNWGERRSE